METKNLDRDDLDSDEHGLGVPATNVNACAHSADAGVWPRYHFLYQKGGRGGGALGGGARTDILNTLEIH